MGVLLVIYAALAVQAGVGPQKPAATPASAKLAGTDVTCAGGSDRAAGSEVALAGAQRVSGHVTISGPYGPGNPTLLIGYTLGDGTQVHIRFDNNLPRAPDGLPVPVAGVRIDHVGADGGKLAGSQLEYVDLADAKFEINFVDGGVELATIGRTLGVGPLRREVITLRSALEPPAQLTMMCFGATYELKDLSLPFPPPAFE
jgi:hypothetical protein